jgi:hypothetical protein
LRGKKNYVNAIIDREPRVWAVRISVENVLYRKMTPNRPINVWWW